MDDVMDLLNVVINGQHALKKELLEEIAKLSKKLDNESGSLRREMKDGFTEVHKRLDKQGAQLAFLEEDTPTREEHDGLERRVGKIEQR